MKLIYEGPEGLTKDNFGFFRCLVDDAKLIAVLTILINYSVDPVVWPKRLGKIWSIMMIEYQTQFGASLLLSMNKAES